MRAYTSVHHASNSMFFFPHPAPSPGCGTLLKLFPSPRRSNAFRGLGLRNGRRKIEPSRAARPSRNSNGSNGRLPALSSTRTAASPPRPLPCKKKYKDIRSSFICFFAGAIPPHCAGRRCFGLCSQRYCLRYNDVRCNKDEYSILQRENLNNI